MSEAIPRLRETAVDPGGQGVAPAEARPLTLILGGGITGLTAGWQLAEAGRAVIVVESSETAGGVAGSLLSRGQVYDFGSHRIHEQYEPEVFRLIKDLLGDDLLRQPRRGQILVQGRFLNYPPSIFQILAAFGLRNGFLFARDYALAALKRLLPGPQPGNFEEYAIASVGGSLYRKFYFPYARKLWNLAPTAISVDPAINRMKKFGVDQVFREVRKRLSLSAAEHYFYYPAQGFGQIGQKVGERFLRLGGRIRYASRATRLEFGEHGRIVAVEIQAKDGSTERLPVDSVVSTIPVDVLDGLLQRDRAGTAGGNLGLVWRSLRLLFVTTPDKVASQHETYYFPEPDYVFGRVSEIGKYGAGDRGSVHRRR
jgi:protoporphyrinogen oxidase